MPLCLVDSPRRKVWKGRIWCLRMCLFTRNRLRPWRSMLHQIARWPHKFSWVCRFKILGTPTQLHRVWNIISSPLHRFVFFVYMAPFTLKIKSHETGCSEMFWSLKRGDIGSIDADWFHWIRLMLMDLRLFLGFYLFIYFVFNENFYEVFPFITWLWSYFPSFFNLLSLQ